MRRGFCAVLAAAVILVSGRVARAETASHPGASVLPTSGASAAPALQSGTIISAENADAHARSIPAAAMFALKHGFHIKVVPTERIQWSAGFEHETEKYSPQVGLDKDGYITNYIAGMPFPLIDFSDPKAAKKVAYNWHFGPVVPDDYSLAPWSSNGYAIDRSQPTMIRPSGPDMVCEQFDFLRFAHRSQIDPRPTLGGNPSGVEWKEKCTKWTETVLGNAGEGANVRVRYLDPLRKDEVFGFSERTRRVRRLQTEVEYSDHNCRECHQPYWSYSLPKTEIYTYRLLGTTAILACMNANDEPAGIDTSGAQFKFTTEPFQLRNAFILEMTPSEKEYADLRTIIFIDSEIYVWLAAEFFENGERVATAIPLWKMKPASGGGNLFDLAGSFYVPSDRPNFFRSLVPAHSSFEQRINTGTLSEGEFRPEALQLQGR